MTRRLHFAYPGSLETRTGGYGYDRRVIACLREIGWDVRLVPLGEGFPSAPDLAAAEAALGSIPAGDVLLVDGLAFGVMDDWAARYGQTFNLFALVHHPLALETGLSSAERARLSASERRALVHTNGIVVTSAATARILTERYDVDAGKIRIAFPGTDPVPLALGGGKDPVILSVGSLTRRKGHDVLITALASLRDLNWTCRIVGSRDLDPDVAAELDEEIRRYGLGERIVLVGEVDDARSEFSRADIFALASRYEGYGMVFAEALAHGLPVVGCAVGAVPEVVPQAAGILVVPDEPGAVAEALRRVLTEPETRSAMADASAVAGARLPSWRDTAAAISSFLEQRI
ncbi:MAG TPA: glycosyltransferase family 4 protein [Pseudorhizobium sp.]|nr:glycosyltransferase family 4 protein [Pseudorhizobium sp.]